MQKATDFYRLHLVNSEISDIRILRLGLTCVAKMLTKCSKELKLLVEILTIKKDIFASASLTKLQ
jgi:hypothetical protein